MGTGGLVILGCSFSLRGPERLLPHLLLRLRATPPQGRVANGKARA